MCEKCINHFTSGLAFVFKQIGTLNADEMAVVSGIYSAGFAARERAFVETVNEPETKH